MRKLATVQEILNIQPIPNADAIELVTVLGWHCVVKKDEFKVGDKCVYIEIDSLIPRYPWSDFLFKAEEEYSRIRTRRMLGQISQGLVIPLSAITNENLPIDEDLTEKLGIKKWEPVVAECMRGKISGNFPSFIRKTDEPRIQGCPGVLERNRDKTYYITEKCDGSSFTAFVKDGKFGVCSRNNQYYEEDDNAFCNAARKLNIKDKLLSTGLNVAIQSEVLAPGIQKNKYKFSALELFTFNIWDIDNQKYYDYADFIDFCQRLNIQTVPILNDNFKLNNMTVDDLVQLSIGESKLAKVKREGIVIRPLVECEDPKIGRLSFKIINPEFLLKHNE
jgi:RNA ligase (TIGR02306 family)